MSTEHPIHCYIYYFFFSIKFNIFYIKLILFSHFYYIFFYQFNISYCIINNKYNILFNSIISNSYRNALFLNNRIKPKIYNYRLGNRPNDTATDYTTYEHALQASTKIPLSLPDDYYILSIETSCDDTAVALLDKTGKIISEYTHSMPELVEKYKGVHPSECRKQHEGIIQTAIDTVISESKIDVKEIGLIAVTKGPGLKMCLYVGYNKAIEFGKLHNIPVVDCNHIAGHVLTPFYDIRAEYKDNEPLDYPFLALVVSGGHTQIYIATSPITYFLVCDTVDTYVGTSLDKASRMLGLFMGNNGAPSLEIAAEKGIDGTIKLKEALTGTHSSHFSFSGINSQLERYITKELEERVLNSVEELPEHVINNYAKSVQNIVFTHVITQLDKAMDIAQILLNINKLVVVGGVACNKELIRMLEEHIKNRNMYSNQIISASKFINRQFKVLRRFRATNVRGNMDTSMLIDALWNGKAAALYPVKSEKNLEDISYVFDNQRWNLVLNAYFASLNPIDIQMIASGLIHIENKTLFSIVDIARHSSESIINKVNALIKDITPEKFNKECMPNQPWVMYTPSNKKCRDNAAMIGWSCIEKIKYNLKIYSNEGDDVYDKWHLSKTRNLDLLAEICKLDAIKLLATELY